MNFIKKSAQNVFSTSEGNKMFLSTKFSYTKIRFENYEAIAIDNKRFIVGKKPVIINEPVFSDNEGKPIITLGDASEDTICSDSSLLFSFLGLIDKLETLPFGNDDEIETAITTTQINLVIEWCIKNGLPFENSLSWENKKGIGFRIGTFFFYLRDLLVDFQQFLHINGIVTNNPLIDFRDIDSCISSLKYRFSNLNLKCSVEFDECFRYIIHAGNMFDAARYQLIMLMTNPSGENIRRCTCCGEWFQPKRKNNKYCPLCSPQMAYKRRKSGTTKEGENSGNDKKTR
jgi:hypothetical protein